MIADPTGLVLVLGGSRSGKSEFAERLIERLPEPRIYVATGTAVDQDMAERIRRHRERRGAGYETVEAGGELAAAVAALPDQPALIDALGTWLAAHHGFEVDTQALVEALRGRTAPTVVVSDEVGLGVHPSTEIGRRFRDALGLVNQAVAAVADDVWLVVAGRGLPLDPP